MGYHDNVNSDQEFLLNMSAISVIEQEIPQNSLCSSSIYKEWTPEELTQLVEAVSNLAGWEDIAFDPYNLGFKSPQIETAKIASYRFIYNPSPVGVLLRPSISNVTSCHGIESRNPHMYAGNLGYLANPNWGNFWICKQNSQATLNMDCHSARKRFSPYIKDVPSPLASVNYYVDEIGKAVYLSRIYGNLIEVTQEVINHIKQCVESLGYKLGFFYRWHSPSTNAFNYYDWDNKGIKYHDDTQYESVEIKSLITVTKPQICYKLTNILTRYPDLKFYQCENSLGDIFIGEENRVWFPENDAKKGINYIFANSEIAKDKKVGTRHTSTLCASCQYVLNKTSRFNRCEHCQNPYLWDVIDALFDQELTQEAFRIDNNSNYFLRFSLENDVIVVDYAIGSSYLNSIGSVSDMIVTHELFLEGPHGSVWVSSGLFKLLQSMNYTLSFDTVLAFYSDQDIVKEGFNKIRKQEIVND